MNPQVLNPTKKNKLRRGLPSVVFLLRFFSLTRYRFLRHIYIISKYHNTLSTGRFRCKLGSPQYIDRLIEKWNAIFWNDIYTTSDNIQPFNGTCI